MGLKTFGEKILREITFLAQKYLWVPGKHWVQKVLGKKMCGKKKFWVQKFFGIKFLEKYEPQ